MFQTFIKLKLLKFTLLTAFGVGVIATLLAKEMHKNKETEDLEG